MNTECTLNQLRGLMQLLRTESDSESSDDDHILPAKVPVKNFGPGDIAKKASTSEIKDIKIEEKSCNGLDTTKDDDKNPYLEINNEPKTLEEWEASQEELNIKVFDTRMEPEYTISYKQALTTEDLFLGMNNKTPATSSCEDMVLEIKLPEETVSIEDMELSVKEQAVDFGSPKYKANIQLPHPVDPNKGKATYNVEYKLLKLVLRMRRELDFVNF